MLKLFDKKISKSERYIQLDQQLSFAKGNVLTRNIARISNDVNKVSVPQIGGKAVHCAMCLIVSD